MLGCNINNITQNSSENRVVLYVAGRNKKLILTYK